MKAQVLLQLNVAMYVDADGQLDAEQLAERIALAVEAQSFSVVAAGERRSFMVDEAVVVDVDEVTP